MHEVVAFLCGIDVYLSIGDLSSLETYFDVIQCTSLGLNICPNALKICKSLDMDACGTDYQELFAWMDTLYTLLNASLFPITYIVA